ncbi:NAD-dependent protein deacylase [Ligilactobacillus acidipiscis]|jgi:NAD-dependent deacetylase|uniref:NAD-dependent protein deacylase n=1 Tax=Ligilactobacillus acidipiscis TaxID=89059 RepID=UPI0029F6040A|nr:NAD-dependent protein deacylase [Ligilactobacillus acidipiscis]MCI1954445.1 NAD-dependent protein deacylase [Ligilactobacillus acidipiscis]
MTELNDLLNQAKHVVFMTGAGVSTASGIPDYRSKNGLYAGQEAPEYLLSAQCLQREPQKHYDFVTKSMIYPDAVPNVIHEKMAEFAQKKGAMIITQNIDGLHSKAGTPAEKLVEFHGNLTNVYCQKCGQTATLAEYQQDMHHKGCGGILRTGIVLYGEPINEDNLRRSLAAIESADLLVVVGTSFVVYPFAGLISYRSPHAKLVAVNKQRISIPENGVMIQNDATKEFSSVNVE